MPRVPTYDNFQVEPTVAPTPRLTNTLPTEQATASGKQLEQTGNQIQRGAANAIAVEVDAAEQANALRVSDAKNKAKELEFPD